MNERLRTGKENISEAAATVVALIVQKELVRQSPGTYSLEFRESKDKSLAEFLRLSPSERSYADFQAQRELAEELRKQRELAEELRKLGTRNNTYGLFEAGAVTVITGNEAPRPEIEITDRRKLVGHLGAAPLSETGISMARTFARPGEDPIPTLLVEAMNRQAQGKESIKEVF